ncbi:Uncharacterised protein [Yersinia enterocolitica]|nr:Uncharacterised protein [Yersinia enterocolitica]
MERHHFCHWREDIEAGPCHRSQRQNMIAHRADHGIIRDGVFKIAVGHHHTNRAGSHPVAISPGTRDAGHLFSPDNVITISATLWGVIPALDDPRPPLVHWLHIGTAFDAVSGSR